MSEITRQEFKQLVDDVREMKSVLIGNRDFGQLGYKDRLEAVERDVENLQDFKRKLVYYTTGGAATATAVVQVMMQVFG